MPAWSARPVIRTPAGTVTRGAGPGGFSSRTGQIGGKGQTALAIDTSFFEAIENMIRQCERTRRGLPVAMDRLVRFMSYTHLGFAQKRSLGPVDPMQRRPELAWKVPVRRISGRYFFGWKVKRRGMGHYEMYNDSREAFFIEFGIHRNPATGLPSTRRIRRPIMKLSFQENMRFLAKTHIYHRVWASTYFPPPGQRKGRGFLWTMQSPAVMAQFNWDKDLFGRAMGGRYGITGIAPK
jgi:hypothetical protein